MKTRKLKELINDSASYLCISMSAYAGDDWASGQYSTGVDSVVEAMSFLAVERTDLMMNSHGFNGGEDVPGHSHEFFELMYVYSGRITHRIGEDVVALKKGDCLLLAPGVYHSIDAFEAEDVAFNFIMYPTFLTPDFLNLISSNSLITDFLLNTEGYKNKQRYLYFPCSEDEEVIDTAEKILCEFLDPDVSSANISKCLLAVLFHNLLRVWKRNGSAVKPRSDIKNRDIIQIIQYIENNVATASLTEAALRFGYEKNYLSKMIKKTLGQSFIEIKHRVCVDYAKAMLTETDKPIMDIAGQIGFNNMSHFYKIFKDKEGVTPAEYREKMIRK
jgi:AraC-like DNA-binding protein/quercetin dioxygenase-like cupin family protein